MNILQRALGTGTILLSTLGLLLCVTLAVGVWAGKGYADAATTAVFWTADEAFEFMEMRLDRVVKSLGTGRQRVNRFSALVERLKTVEGDASAAIEPLSKTLDEVYRELQAAEQWLDSSEAVARGVNRIVDGLAASRSDDAGDASRGVKAKQVAEFSAGVVDALAKLEVMRQELIELREQRILAREFAARVIDQVKELVARLTNVSARIEGFNARVSAARASCAYRGRSVHRWITFTAIILTLVLLWFGASQIAMMKRGWQFARRSTMGFAQSGGPASSAD